ncbi:proton-conducting transporter membrane subunit [Streptomyces sp. DSM 44917]|uniref:Proton-conducting transporter membrane subunit n=1 Tax=Streptomyces boetiae TaxID=3075541 RepID=A0ABU2L9T3_9ACTN|nr:proton-conducting transporter membrane subunit [Streptomyces sp. DSM 44917]MDT0308092.1 proton-conducting transporter membrane subunit [Streptomyces sp. DSM 44917]
MTTLLVAAPVLLPVLAAGVSLLLVRNAAAQRVLTVVVLAAVLADAAVLLHRAARAPDNTAAVVDAGGWSPPLGIALVADLPATLLLTVAVLVALAVLLFAIGQGAADHAAAIALPFHPAYLLLIGGVALAFLSGDLFNLFVAFEVMLASSYVLLTVNAGEARVRAGMTYTMTSLTSSLLFLTAVALTYAATGTVSLAQLAERTAALPEGVRAGLGTFLLAVFAIKAAVVPLHFWLPDGYPTAPAPITAVFAALLTKVGVYAMLRTQTLLFPRGDETWWLVTCAAILTMVVGILGAIAQDDVNRLLSFTLVSHIGFMLLGLALGDVAGLTGTLLYVVHHIVAQASLFLVAGLLAGSTGTTSLHLMEERRRAADAGGEPEEAGTGEGARGRRPPALTWLFLLPGLSLAGIPPFSGFIAKFALLRAAVAEGGPAAWSLAAAALMTSLLTLYAMLRVWRAVCSPPARLPSGAQTLTVGATGGMILVGLALAVCAGPLADLSERAAEHLADPGSYAEERPEPAEERP